MSITPSFETPETVIVQSRHVKCDGDGPDGHPRIFLNMGDKDFVECPYCDRRFELDPKSANITNHH